MKPAIETELSRRLRQHREQHPGCDRHCAEYFDLARRATDARKITEGRINVAYAWLSVREAVNF